MSTAERLYLDHAATTPVLPEASAAVAAAMEVWANPSSPHGEGRAARAALECARRSIAESLGWRHDVILTSGASEAIAIAARGALVVGRAIGATEHDAVSAVMGRAKTVAVNAGGLIDMASLDAALAAGPTLVAIQHINNETGVIQPLDQIYERAAAAGALLLADCAQSAGKLPLPEADFIAISGHKLGAPPGIGALLVKDLSSLRAAGGQERGYRRGTENLPGAAGVASALQARAFGAARAHIEQLRASLEARLMGEGAIAIASEAERSAFIGAYAMPGVANASQLVQFDLAGIAVSTGSACSSGSMKPSRVLEAMAVPTDLASSVIRVSFGPATNENDIDRFVAEWRRIRDRARAQAA